MKVNPRKAINGDDHYIVCYWWCPGCESAHIWQVDSKGINWEWNRDTEKPTVTPSILTDGNRPERRCHVFIRDGVIDFLSDSAHKLAGQKVPMVDLPDWLAEQQ